MNTRNWRIAAIAAAVVCVAGATGAAEAACNSFPSGGSFFSERTNEPGLGDPVEFPFAGAVGRIDRAVIVPGVTPFVGAQPKADSGVNATRLSSPDVVGLVIRPGNGDRKTAITAYTTRKAWGSIGQLVTNLAIRFGDSTTIVSATRPLAVRAAEHGGPRLDFTVRQLDAHPAHAKKGSRFALIVVDASVLDKHKDLSWLAGRDGTWPCKELLARESNLSGVHVCVDRLFALPKNSAVRPTSFDDDTVDLLGCEVLVTGTPNNFSEHCDQDEPGTDEEMYDCEKDHPGTLHATVSSCGALVIPFDYESLRKPKGGKGHPWIRRKLAGLSALPRSASNDASGSIHIPGLEFVGTIAPSETNPGNVRKPDIEATPPRTGTPHELELTGSVDEDQSVVILFPRVPVSMTCIEPVSGKTEACQTFNPEGQTTVAICSRKGGTCPESGCCKIPTDPVRYFECEGEGPTVGRPCTRSEHCGPDAQCTGQTVCRPRGTIWQSPSNEKGIACSDDSTCERTRYPQCGRMLFDLRPPNQKDIAAYVLDYESNGGVGVCKFDRTKQCSSSPCRNGGGPCVRYSLQARGKKSD